MSYPMRGQDPGGRESFAGLENMRDWMNRLMGETFAGYRDRFPRWRPDVDIDEDTDGWVVEARLPGVAPEEVAIDVSGRELVIRAVHEETAGSGGRSRHSDFSYRLVIPPDANTDAIDATMDHGLLLVRLPRSSTSGSRRITVGRRSAIAGESTAISAGSADTEAGTGQSAERPVTDTDTSGV